MDSFVASVGGHQIPPVNPCERQVFHQDRQQASLFRHTIGGQHLCWSSIRVLA